MADNNVALTAKVKKLAKTLPRTHALLIGLAIIGAFFSLLLPSGKVEANRRPPPLAAAVDTNPQLALTSLTDPVLHEPTVAPKVHDQPKWKELVVHKGDSLGKLFERAGVSATDLAEVLHCGAEADTLKHIYPGQKLAFQIDQKGHLIALRYQETRLKSIQYYRDNTKGFVAEKVSRDPIAHHRFARGTIKSSLYQAGTNAGLSYNMILQLANVFGGVIDFAHDIRPHDHFVVMYDEYYLNGKKISDGPILAASFTNQGRTYTAYRYVYSNGNVGYYSSKGRSMRRIFMRAPLHYTRISSPFSLHRFDPYLKEWRPHYGIDYAAPIGTPVYAAGAGRVVKSSRSGPNGNFIVIRHNSVYTTLYLHLSKRYVKVGQHVKEHQLIGAVGETGWATGPHLHYEFHVNGKPVNPAKIAKYLPKIKQIAANQRHRFEQQVHSVEMQFVAYEHHDQNLANDKLAEEDTTADRDRAQL